MTMTFHLEDNCYIQLPLTFDFEGQGHNFLLLSMADYVRIPATNSNKAYRPIAHLLYIVMHYNGNII